MTKTIPDSLSTLFERDLLKLKKEIQGYSNEQELWIVQNDISNSAGNLCLHLIGNINHFIGANLGKTTYKRNRHSEFNEKDIKRSMMIQMIDDTIDMLKNVIPGLMDSQLEKAYPEKVFGYEMSTSFFLLHLLGHLNYHLGQINYHRRLLTKSD